MNETINIALKTNENPEVGNGLDATGDLVALRMVCGKRIPGILRALLDAQGDATTLLVDIQHHHLDLITQLNDLGRVNVFVGPVHFRDVYQTFDPLFDLGKTAVVGEVGHRGNHAATLRIAAGNLHPWILTQLLEAQRYAIALTVKLKDFHIHFLTNFHNLARVLDTLPRHISDVQQSIDTTKIDKCAVVGQVLHYALHRLAFLQVLQQFLTFCTVSRLHNGAARHHHVVALLIQLDDFKFEFFALEVRGLANGANIDQ